LGTAPPSLQPIIKVLLPKPRDIQPDLASTALEAIGNLAEIGGDDMREFVPEPMEILIENLQDLSSDSKRTTALHTMGQVATSCGYVIEPYKVHPEVMVILKNIIKMEPPLFAERGGPAALDWCHRPKPKMACKRRIMAHFTFAIRVYKMTVFRRSALGLLGHT
jgi:hypothetical protein